MQIGCKIKFVEKISQRLTVHCNWVEARDKSQETRAEMQEPRSKKQEPRSKSREAINKRQVIRAEKQEIIKKKCLVSSTNFHFFIQR